MKPGKSSGDFIESRLSLHNLADLSKPEILDVTPDDRAESEASLARTAERMAARRASFQFEDGKPAEPGDRFELPFPPVTGKLKVNPTINAARLRGREIPARTYLPMLGQDGYFILGKTHILAAFPKTGKTELMAVCLHDWNSLPIIPGGIAPDGMMYPKTMYFGEESADAWTERLQKLPDSRNWDQMDYVPALGLTEKQMMALIHSHDGDPDDWAGDYVLGEAVAYDIVVIDSMRSMLNIENENDNSEVTAKLKPWVELSQRTGITLIILHHTRKTGGEHGLGVAGGSGSIALVDHVIQMDRDTDNDERRFITATGRGGKDPDKAIIGWKETTNKSGIGTGRYRLEYLGAAGKVRKGDIEARAYEVVKQAQEPMTTQEVSDRLLEPPIPGLTVVKNALKSLAYAGRIVRDPEITETASRRTVRWSLPKQEIDI